MNIKHWTSSNVCIVYYHYLILHNTMLSRNRFSIRIREDQLSELPSLLQQFQDSDRILEFQKQGTMIMYIIIMSIK